MIQTSLKEITPAVVGKMLEDYQGTSRQMKYLQSYYEGGHSILARESRSDNVHEDNRLVNAYAGYITDVNVGYFMGKPVSYASDDEMFIEELTDIFDLNNEQDENVELSKGASVMGKCYELLYTDEQSNLRFNELSPVNSFMVYDQTIDPEPVCFVYFWQTTEDGKETQNVMVYTSTEQVWYKGKDKSLIEVERKAHPFRDVPAVEYANNAERQGDFQKVLSLIDAYDAAQSDAANEFESWADAYLKIINMSQTTSKDIDDMRRDRVILVDQDGDADWMVKNHADAAQENYKSRLQEDIHKFSLTPNLNDDNFSGNSSGIAMMYKLWVMEQQVAQKERKFKRGLQRRLMLICNFLAVHGKSYDWRGVDITFSRNVPPLLIEMADMVTKLRGLVSDKTLLGWLPNIEDPEAEYEALQEQKSEGIDLSQFMVEGDDDGEDTPV